MTDNDDDLRAAVERLVGAYDRRPHQTAQDVVDSLRALLAEHPAPEPTSDEAAMHIDPEPPGVTTRPFTDAEVAALDAECCASGRCEVCSPGSGWNA